MLSQDASPLHETLLFPEQSPHHGWFAARSAAVGETHLSGWPLVVGTDPDTRKGGFLSSPLLVSEVELGKSGDAWQLQNLGANADLTPSALDIIGTDKEARDERVAAVAASVEVGESMTSFARRPRVVPGEGDRTRLPFRRGDPGLKETGRAGAPLRGRICESMGDPSQNCAAWTGSRRSWNRVETTGVTPTR